MGCPASTPQPNQRTVSLTAKGTSSLPARRSRKAGNEGKGSVSDIKIDRTAPVLNGTPSTTNWSREDVTVTWAASDALSGLVGDVPAPSVVNGEGADLSATTSVSDKAGNSTSTTVD